MAVKMSIKSAKRLGVVKYSYSFGKTATPKIKVNNSKIKTKNNKK